MCVGLVGGRREDYRYLYLPIMEVERCVEPIGGINQMMRFFSL